MAPVCCTMTAHHFLGWVRRDHWGFGLALWTRDRAGILVSLTCQGYPHLCVLCIDYPKDSPMLCPCP